MGTCRAKALGRVGESGLELWAEGTVVKGPQQPGGSYPGGRGQAGFCLGASALLGAALDRPLPARQEAAPVLSWTRRWGLGGGASL